MSNLSEQDTSSFKEKQQQQTLKTIQDSQLDFSGLVLLNEKPLLLPTGRRRFKET